MILKNKSVISLFNRSVAILRDKNLFLNLSSSVIIVAVFAVVIMEVLGFGESAWAQAISGISGDVVHGDSVIISGSGFGTKTQAAPELWDTVENITAYSGFADGDVISIGDGYIWGYNGGKGDFQNPMRYNISRPQRGVSAAQYSTHPNALGGTIGDRTVSGPNMYVSWWWKPSVNWEPLGQSNKILRAASEIYWPSKEQFSWRRIQTYIFEYQGAGYIMNEWPLWHQTGGVDGEWNRQEVYFDNQSQTVYQYTNSNLVGSYSYAGAVEDMLAIHQIGVNPNGDVPGLIVDLDDIYLDSTQARVEIGDNSSWDNCTHREIQIPTAWSSDLISITANQGSFSEGDTAYLFVVDENGNISDGYQITIGSGAPDLTPPSRSNSQPTGTLTSGTTSTTISLDTSETATCKYSETPNTAYNDMTLQLGSGQATSHSQTVSNLSDGNSYTYYIRCQDESGNQNTDDFTISFSIASPSTTYTITNFINLVANWLTSGSGLESDVNNDGVVNTRDLGIMMSHWSD